MAHNSNRPLSPHLQVYQLPLTGLISITHRMTGVALIVGLFLICLMVVAATQGAESYALLQSYLQNPLIKLVFWSAIYALCFHICHGVRHLIWDAGNGFAKADLHRYALIELGASLLLTLLCFFIL